MPPAGPGHCAGACPRASRSGQAGPGSYPKPKVRSGFGQRTIYFTDLVAPPWGQDMFWDPTKVIKFQIDMQQPGDGAPDIPFDVWVDEVRWIIPGESTAHAGVPATSGCVPAPAPAG